MNARHDPLAPRYQLFFDESGKSDLGDASKCDQHHLILAGVLVPWDSPFWEQVMEAWSHAATLLAEDPEKVELHGTDIYGGNGPWKGVRGRLQVLDITVNSLRDHGIRIYWTGLPIKTLKVIETRAWKKVLTKYFDLLSARLQADLNSATVEVYADANDWVGIGSGLKNEEWTAFTEQTVSFHDSRTVHGIQVADIVAHTLYRSNKSAKSNTDIQAEKYRVLLSENFFHLPE